MVGGKSWKRLTLFFLLFFITLLITLKIEGFNPQFDDYFVNINTLTIPENIHLYNLLLECEKGKLDEQSCLIIAAAIECGSIPTDGCIVTKDTTFVKGTYNLNYGIRIMNTGNIVLDCNGATLKASSYTGNHGILIHSSTTGYVTIKNCIIEGNYVSGIMINGGIYNTITANTIKNTYYGIFISTDYNTFTNNDITGTSIEGIYVGGNDNQIRTNTIYSNSEGIYILSTVNNNQIYSNVFCPSNSNDFSGSQGTNYGDNNKCDNPNIWNDQGTIGCTYSCIQECTPGTVCCDSTGHYRPYGYDCGTCKVCNGAGSCSVKPSDDSDCGVISCDDWHHIVGLPNATGTNYCYDSPDITSNRCEAFGDCKDANTADCGTADDTLELSCDICKYVDGCSGTTDGYCTNYVQGTSCGDNKECDGDGNCVEIDTCVNGIKDGDETDIDCGGSKCKPCVSCDNRIRDGDEEQTDCGGSCPEPCYKLKILSIPIEWHGNQASFDNDVDRLINFFIDDINLVNCKEKVEVIKVNVTQYNISNWLCWWDRPNYIYKFAEKAGLKPDEYNYVLGFVDHNICGDQAGESNSIQTAWVETVGGDDSIAAHEIGHFYGLEDEYCSNPAGSLHPYCNDGDMGYPPDNGGDGAETGDKNWLDDNLGCNPSEGGNCCELGTIIGINESGDYTLYSIPNCIWYKPCCRGNYNSKGGLATMAAYKAQYVFKDQYGGFTSPRGFDNHSKSILNQQSELSCSETLSIKTSETFSFSSISSNKMIDINLLLFQNNSVRINWINLLDGKPDHYGKNYGNLNLTLEDENGTPIWYRPYYRYFDYNGPMSFDKDYSNLTFNSIEISAKAPYSNEMKRLVLYLNGSEVFSSDLNFCNNNSICDGDETYLSCWKDCRPWSNDGLCIAKEDSHCDLDCVEGIDPDCPPIIKILSPTNNVIYHTSFVDLNWTVDKDVSWCAYSLDNKANDTSIYLNSWSYQEDSNYLSVVNDDMNGYLYINYTKPSGATPLSKWQVKHGYNGTNALLYNITLPLACWDAYEDKLILRVLSRDIPPENNNSQPQCYNGIGWIDVGIKCNSNGSSATGMVGDYQSLMYDGNWNTGAFWSFGPNRWEVSTSGWTLYSMVYEEAIWWNIIEIKNFTLINLPRGHHNITIYCNDASGNMGQSDYVYFTVELPGVININLKKGWNLLSFPLNLPNKNINSIFPNLNITIFSYKNNSWFIPTEIENKLGYWLKTNQSKNITLIGTEIENITIDLNEGWNLISYPSLNITLINESLKEVNNTYDLILTYKDNKWSSYSKTKPINTLENLTPFYGYWVKVPENVTWTFDGIFK